MDGYQRPVFGSSLKWASITSMYDDGIRVPKVVRDCISFIEENLNEEGLYRVSGAHSKIENLRVVYDDYKDANLPQMGIHTITGLLKLYLRSLPDPIINSLTVKYLKQALEKEMTSKVRYETVKSILEELPKENFHTASYVITHLHNVQEHVWPNEKIRYRGVKKQFNERVNVLGGSCITS